MTHEHDIDVLLALADAGADPTSPEVAERLDHCAECLEDLHLQIVAVEALQEATPPTLSEHEAHRLRRDVNRALEHRSSGSAGSAATGWRARRAWGMLAGVAAVTLAVAVGAPMLGNVFGGAADMAGDEDSFAATPFDARSGAPEELAEEDMSLFTTEVAEDQATTTWAAADSGGDDTAAGSPHAVSGDLAFLQDLVAGEDAAGARDKLADTAFATSDSELGIVTMSDGDSAADNRCAVEGSLLVGGPTDSYTLGVFELDSDPNPVVVTVHVEPSGVTTVIAHEVETCDVIMATS